ncbi:MAG: iron-containing alcohol dehydrogenase, partial [Armatimonadetes bacterium]|nr:iron-containing alcohol dehydrogenase [Armatimonadota bacterium]
MIQFEQQTPSRVLFGWGYAERIGAEAAALGQRPLVVTGRSLRASGALDRILAGLRDQGLQPLLYEGVPAEPGLDALQAVMDAAVEADSVIAIGGGSVLDIGKGAAALAPRTGHVGPTAREV